jgi:hypothetical protein
MMTVDINWDELRATIREKVEDPRCPACERNSWDGGNAIVHLPLLFEQPTNGAPRDPEGKPGVAVILFSCSHCGSIRMFDVATLLGEE